MALHMHRHADLTPPPPMKPNILVVQPSPADGDSSIDHFCETLSKTHYVYLIRPIEGFREDSPAGVRFLNFSPERLPGFGEVESIIIVDGAEHASRLQEEYPTARQWLWNRNPDGGDPTSLVALDRDTIIQGDFSDSASAPYARAM